MFQRLNFANCNISSSLKVRLHANTILGKGWNLREAGESGEESREGERTNRKESITYQASTWQITQNNFRDTNCTSTPQDSVGDGGGKECICWLLTIFFLPLVSTPPHFQVTSSTCLRQPQEPTAPWLLNQSCQHSAESSLMPNWHHNVEPLHPQWQMMEAASATWTITLGTMQAIWSQYSQHLGPVLIHWDPQNTLYRVK